MEHPEGSERMVEIVTVLAVVGEALAVLVARLASATATEIPAICKEAENLARRVVDCCIDTAPSDHLPPEEAAALRVELVQLAATLQAQITGIIDLRLAQIMGGVASRTSH
jgi:hypothetical protein